MSKKKRKNKAPHVRTAAPNERRRVISYDDIEEGAAPPIPRQKVSYASDSNDDDDDDADDTPSQRHAVVSREALKERERPQTDVTYGQTGAFPGLDPCDKEPFYGPANDGLDYLRMVRSEARGIPHIVTAPPPNRPQNDESPDDDYDDHVDDYDGYYEDDSYFGPDESQDEGEQGWYEDGAYVALSTAGPTIGPVQSGTNPQDAFYESLKTRFKKLRQELRTPPSIQALHGLDNNHPISLPAGNKFADKEWKTHLLHTTPLPAQLASMDSPSILRLLKLVEGQLENCRSTNIPQNLSMWAWALLAKLEDVGLLQTRDVSVVRDLAKMAVWVRMMHHKAKYGRSNDPAEEYLDRYPEENAGAQESDEDVSEDQPAATDAAVLEGEDANAAARVKEETTVKADQVPPMDLDSADELSDIIAAKKRQLEADAEAEAEKQGKNQEPWEFPDVNTRVTIDMLVTVAAEFYGQKDLLVGRIPWEKPSD